MSSVLDISTFNVCFFILDFSNIRDPPNVHLLYDILDFKPKEIHKAVLFSTNNALVCETQDDANRVAYDLEPGQRFDVSFKFFNRSEICKFPKKYML